CGITTHWCNFFARQALSVSLVHHAMHALGSRALGFTQELFAPRNDVDSGLDVAAIMRGQLAEDYPYITEIAVIEAANHDPDSTLGWCDDQVEFEFRARSAPRWPRPTPQAPARSRR